ncbi:RidA family protein [Falsiroseomonas sp. E2-1-a20]|uniref:RidA family protein n=1 Tax=Falsiroseomonas sp. E2-1-a20 TaxID=3239300 RepID=UPI003F31CC45
MTAERRLAELGLTLPSAPAPLANYVPWRIGGGLLFLSGVGPRRADGSSVTGVLGGDLTVAQGYDAARLCGLNLLANMRTALGTLDRVDTILKVLGMVRAGLDFGEQPEVINGCTDLFVEVFGDAGRPARSAVGMGSLPRGIAVEIEAVVLIRG